MSVDNSDIKKKMIDALEASLGIVSTAIVTVGIARSTHYKWLSEDPDYKAAVDALDDIVLDFSESALHGKIKEGDTASILFHLKCKGKKRGYIERTQVETRTVDDFLTDEEREELAQLRTDQSKDGDQ